MAIRPQATDSSGNAIAGQSAVCAFRGDAESLRTLVSALLDNAVRYTPAGGRIDGTLERAAGDAEPIVLRVSDTGVGLPADEVPHVFDRFYRVSKDRSCETGGAGLGLAIVRAIARQHGGDAAMTSVPGDGSTVTITFPSNASGDTRIQ